MISAKAKKQRGVALLAAMILVLAVTMILSNIFYRHQIEVSQAMASLHSDQALLIALSGEGWAMELLAEDPTGGQPNHQTIMAKFGLKLCRYYQLRVAHSLAVLVTCRARLTSIIFDSMALKDKAQNDHCKQILTS